MAEIMDCAPGWNQWRSRMRRAGAGCGVLLLFMLFLSTGSVRAATTLTNRAALKFSGTRVLTAPKQNLSATGVLRSGKVLLPIEKGVDSKTLELFVRNGTNFVAMPNPVMNYQGTPHLVTPTNKVYIVRDQKIAENQVLAKKQLFLSGEVALNTADQKVVRGKLYVLPESMMAWDPDDNAYAATLSIGFASTNEPAQAKRLLPLTVRFRADHLKWSTNLVVIENPGIAGEAQVRVWSQKFYTNETIAARSDLGEETITVAFEELGFLGFVGLIFPLPVWGAILVGGSLGGVLRMFHATRKRRGEWYWLVLEGGIAGLLLMAFLSVGLVSLPITISPGLLGSALGSFAVSALAGYYGTRLIDRLTKNFVAEEKESTREEKATSGK